MIVIEYRQIELDYCPACSGVWFDSGELELMLNAYHMKEIRPFLDGITGSAGVPSKEKKRKCPICNRDMKKADIGESGRVLIDVCHQGHGLWFDGGEVMQLLKQMAEAQPAATDTGGEVISFMWEVFQPPE